jgi:hypothetical protein
MRSYVELHHGLIGDILIAINPRFGLFWKNETGAVKMPSGSFVRFGLKGSSDILGVCRGRFVAIEVKTGEATLRKSQRNFREAVTKNGGIYCLARNVEGVVDLLKSI